MISKKLARKLFETANNLIHLPDARSKHFSFIVERNCILSVGWNKSFKTHPLAKRYGHRFSSIHSELDAIKNFPYAPASLIYYKFVNLRIMGDGSVGLSKPCVHCQELLAKFGIEQIYYSDHDGNFHEF